MKRILVLLSALLLSFALFACDGEATEHSKVFGENLIVVAKGDTLKRVTKNIELLTESQLVPDASISWESKNTDVISIEGNVGIVHRDAEEDKSVQLVLSVDIAGDVKTKQFTLTVLKLEEVTDPTGGTEVTDPTGGTEVPVEHSVVVDWDFGVEPVLGYSEGELYWTNSDGKDAFAQKDRVQINTSNFAPHNDGHFLVFSIRNTSSEAWLELDFSELVEISKISFEVNVWNNTLLETVKETPEGKFVLQVKVDGEWVDLEAVGEITNLLEVLTFEEYVEVVFEVENPGLYRILYAGESDATGNTTHAVTLDNLVVHGITPEAVHHTVSFLDEEGNELLDSVSIQSGYKVHAPENPEKEGFLFIEWQLDGEKYNFNQEVIKDIELVAVWQEIEGDLAFHWDFGSKQVTGYVMGNLEWTNTDDTEVKVKKDRVQIYTSTFTPHEANNAFLVFSVRDTNHESWLELDLVHFEELSKISFSVASYNNTHIETILNTPNSKMILQVKAGENWVDVETKDGLNDILPLLDASKYVEVEFEVDGPGLYRIFYTGESTATDNTTTAVTVDNLMVFGVEGEEKEVVKYTVSFNSDGGPEVEPQEVEEFETASQPTVQMVKEGYLFLGWFLGEERFVFNTPITSNIELVAKWELEEVTEFDHEEKFEEQEALTGNYATGSFVGANNVTFEYKDSRDEGDYPISGKGIMLRHPSSYLQFTLTDGLSELSFDYMKAFTGSSKRVIEVYVNDVLIASTDDFKDSTNKHTLLLEEINVSGVVQVKIKVSGVGTSNAQVTLDNIQWSEYDGQGSTEPNPTETEPENPQGTEIVAKYVGETGNMLEDNNAELIGLDSELFEVISTARQIAPINLHVGLNKDGTIRLYGASTYISKSTIAILVAEGYVITKVEITFGAGSATPTHGLLMLGSEEVLLGESDLASTTKIYEGLSIDGFSLRNVQDGGEGNSQIFIAEIKITYEEGTATSNFVPVPAVKVSFDAKGGSNIPARFFEDGDIFVVPASATKEGFNFDGWYLDESYETELNLEMELVEDITLYAKWLRKSDEVLVTEAKNSLVIDTDDVYENKVLELPLVGRHDVEIQWDVVSGAGIIDLVTGQITMPVETTELVLKAYLSLGEVEQTKEFTINIVVVEEGSLFATAEYETGKGTTNAPADTNIAETLGLDPTIFTVIAIKGSANQNLGLNNAGNMRLYFHASGGTTLQITIAAGYKIREVQFEVLGTAGNAKFIMGEAESTVTGANLQNKTTIFDELDITSFSMQNVNTTNTQIYLKSIKIFYEEA